MTWAAIGVGAATVIGGAVSADKQADATKKSGKKLSSAQAAAQALNEQRYQEAKQTLSPYLASSSIANRQLMIELGLGDQYAAAEQKQGVDELSSLQSQLEELQAAKASYTVAQKKSKKKENWLSKATGITDVKQLSGTEIWKGKEARALGSYLTTGKSQFKGMKKEDFEPAIVAMQKKIAAQQGIVDKYGSTPQAPQDAPGTAYMRTPVYQGAIKAGIDTVNAGASDVGALYSGARGEALKDVGQGVNQSMYNNYMNILQNTANPATATNLGNIGINQAANIGQQNLAVQQQQNAYTMQGAADKGAFYSDVAGGLSNAFTAYMNRPKTPKMGVSAPQNGGSATNFSGYA